jgi:hypothetical protein
MIDVATAYRSLWSRLSNCALRFRTLIFRAVTKGSGMPWHHPVT